MDSTKPSSLSTALWWLPKKLTALNARAEAISGKIPEMVVLCLFCVLKAVMGVFHEPWFDEAVAWQIAREATFKDILFSVPHYEGHPPLWHLVLLPFAKLGAPYEASLAFVSLVFVALAVFLILWYAPFPRLVKWVLPFTYFYFYQFAVISRPYCMMTLAFVLCALSFEKRDKFPWLYVLSLAFLCLTSAFGIAIAGGLALAWVVEIVREKPLASMFKELLSDKRCWWLLGLLLLAVLLILEILPAKDTYALAAKAATKQDLTVTSFLYVLLALPTDFFLASIFSGYNFVFDMSFGGATFWASCVVGLLIWTLFFLLAKRKGLLLTLFLPYVLFAVFGAVVYMCSHHGGIGYLFLLFFLWIAIKTPDKKSKSEKPAVLGLKAGATVLVALSLCVSLYWNISSCVVDVKKPYSSARLTAAFLKEHHLDTYRVMTGWMSDEDVFDINLTISAELMPYFDHNIFFNFMGGDDHQNYITHRFATEEETRQAFALWKAGGLPDVLVNDPAAGMVFGDDFLLKDYAVVFHTIGGKIWKGGDQLDSTSVLVRRELLPELGLKEMTVAEMLAIDREQE